MTTTRRLAAIFAADVAGYSRLMGADEEGTLDRLRSIRAEVIDPKIAEHRGRIVKTTGDGLLVEFGSASDMASPAGWQRAGALATFFAPPDDHFRDQRIEKPLAIFASRVAPHSKSLRPQHTVEPLAELIGQERLRLDFAEGEEQQLVAAAIAVDGMALISRHHETIPAIKDLLLGDQTRPRKWDKQRFDLVWVFTRTAASWRFEQVPQFLLAGDKPNPIE